LQSARTRRNSGLFSRGRKRETTNGEEREEKKTMHQKDSAFSGLSKKYGGRQGKSESTPRTKSRKHGGTRGPQEQQRDEKSYSGKKIDQRSQTTDEKESREKRQKKFGTTAGKTLPVTSRTFRISVSEMGQDDIQEGGGRRQGFPIEEREPKCQEALGAIYNSSRTEGKEAEATCAKWLASEKKRPKKKVMKFAAPFIL